MMNYKGYLGQIDFDDEADIFHGEVINTRDVITFQGKTTKELRKAFHASIDEYLAFCERRGRQPEKPFSGKFVVRCPSPDIHRNFFIAAKSQGMSLNKWVIETLAKNTYGVESKTDIWQ